MKKTQGEIGMKKIMVIAAAAGLAAWGHADELEIMGVEVSGYLDMSASVTESDAGSESSAGLDTAEIRFKSELADGVYVEAHVAGYGAEDGDANTIDLEQAFVTYSAISNVTIIGGKWLSSLGWEAYHAPDLFQYSTSATLVYPGMENGLGVKYAFDDTLSVFVAALSSAWDSDDKDPENGAFEGNVRFTGIEDFTLFVGGATEKYVGYDQMLANIWASYVLGDLILAGEVNVLDDWEADGNEGFGWLLMANYAITEKLGLTLRTSALNVEDAGGADVTDLQKFTIAPSYALTDNLSFVLEFNTLDDSVADDTFDTIAFETIVTF
jgi:hypothetical protein